MFDFSVSTHCHFDEACRAFSAKHNIIQLAKKAGLNPQTISNKLNPEQVHQLAPATVFDFWNGEAWETNTQAQQAAAVNAAQAEKSARISEANRVTQAWQTQLMLGIITDADKATLTKWMQYIQAVQAVDVSTIPTIVWPDHPL